LLLLLADRSCNFRKIAGFAEVLIDAGEADVGDVIDRLETVHHRLADLCRRDFVAAGLQLALDRVDQAADPLRADVALPACNSDRAGKFVADEWLALAKLLDDD